MSWYFLPVEIRGKDRVTLAVSAAESFAACGDLSATCLSADQLRIASTARTPERMPITNVLVIRARPHMRPPSADAPRLERPLTNLEQQGHP